MVKNEGVLIAGAIIVAVLLLGQQGGQTAPPSDDGTSAGGVDLCKLVDGQVSFTGQNKYLAGTALTSDWVRVIKQNDGGMVKDIGQVSMNSGTLSTTPKAVYKLYFGENTSSTTRYTSVESYTAPCQDAPDDRVGILCTVDTTPTVTVFDENGQVQSGTTNAQAMGANDIIDVEVKVKAAADRCYGNPSMPEDKANAICFTYNGTVFDSVKSNTGSSSIPYSVSSDSQKLAGYSQSCYKLNKLADTGNQILSVTLDASGTEPTGQGHAINITLEDVDFDLNQDTLEEIWGFEDESNTNLGAAIYRVAGIQVT